MEKLIVNGEHLDLYPNSEIKLNFRVNEISDISSRNSSYSNTISVPRTSKNTRIFEYAGVMGTMGRMPYKKLRCSYQQGGINIIQNGYLYLMETTPDEYKIALFDGIIDIQEKLGDKTLRDLDTSFLNHNLTRANYENSFANTSGYIYGVADYGKDISSDITIEYQSPSVYAHTLWSTIFSDAGLNYTGDFFDNNTDFYEYVVTPSVGYDPVETEPVITQIADDVEGTARVLISNQSSFHTKRGDIDIPTTESGKFTSKMTVETNGNLTVNYTGVLKMRVVNLGAKTYGAFGVGLVYVNEQIKFSRNLVGWTQAQSITDDTYQFSVTTGDVIRFESLWYSQETAPNTHQIDSQVNVFLELHEVVGGFEVNIGNTLPAMKQTEFLKDIMQRFGLIMRKSDVADTYEFIEIEKMLGDGSNVIDMTSKLIKIKSESYVSGYAQNNTASYKYPDGASTTPYNGSIVIDNEVADVTRELFSSPFEIPNLKYSAYANSIYGIPIWEDKNGVLDPKESPAKYMKVSRQTKTIATRYFTPSSTQNVTADFPFLTLTNVGYDYFLATYYPRFKGMLEDYKEIEVELDLNPIDIYNLDFFKLVYLKQTGRYYYLDTVKIGRTNTAKLIEIPNPNI